MATVQEALNIAQPNDLPDMLRKVNLGDIIAGMLVPVTDSVARAVAAHVCVLDTAGEVKAVTATAGGTTGNCLLVPAGATPATGQVAVSYSAEGVATLTFAAGDAVTACKVQKTTMPAGLGTILAADAGACY